MSNLGTLAEGSALPELTFGSGVLGSGHHFHGLGDLLNVLDRLEAHGNGLQGGHATLLWLPTGKLVRLVEKYCIFGRGQAAAVC
jgi:hypothetical protein